MDEWMDDDDDVEWNPIHSQIVAATVACNRSTRRRLLTQAARFDVVLVFLAPVAVLSADVLPASARTGRDVALEVHRPGRVAVACWTRTENTPCK